MTTEVDIVNRALQCLGTRTTVTAAELANETSNEAIQANLIRTQLRDETLRMAPWNCATAFIPLSYITSTPGTPENTSMGTPLWATGQPPPPWSYEYQYPPDCLRPLYVVPQFQSGFTSGIPISGVVTGGAAAFWQGPPVKFKVATDNFFSFTGISVLTPGINYVVGDLLTLQRGPNNQPPVGAPVQLVITSVNGTGGITGVEIVSAVLDADPPIGGSYYLSALSVFNSINGVSSSVFGVGTGATFTANATQITANTQRVILTNQEFALLSYVKQIEDPNVMDPLFVEAWVSILGARLVMALVGDKQLANIKVQEANKAIMEARVADGNEGLTVNDITPDWIRVRGISYSDYSYTPNVDFNWGQLWTPF